MPRTRNLVFIISILMLLGTLPATAQESSATDAPITQALTQMVENVLSWFDSLIEPPQNTGVVCGDGNPDGEGCGDDEFSPMIEPGG